MHRCSEKMACAIICLFQTSWFHGSDDFGFDVTDCLTGTNVLSFPLRLLPSPESFYLLGYSTVSDISDFDIRESISARSGK